MHKLLFLVNVHVYVNANDLRALFHLLTHTYISYTILIIWHRYLPKYIYINCNNKIIIEKVCEKLHHAYAHSAYQYSIMIIVYNLSFVLMINWKFPDYRNEWNSIRSACVSVIQPISYPQPWFKRRIFLFICVIL